MKTVLITGGSRGIGKAMVEAFCKASYNVAFTYKSSEREAMELERINGAFAINADSENEAEITNAVKLVGEKFGSIDILINNAAVSSFGTILDLSLEEWNRTHSVCLTASFLYSKCVIPYMLKKKWGRIINISSMWGIVGSSCEVHYSAAKAGLIGFTKALAKELGPSGITVNAIAPGVIDTDMNKCLDQEVLDGLCEETPVGRIGLPSEVAECALFLAGDNSAFITGDVVNLSGGYIV